MDFQEIQSTKQRFGIIGNSDKLNYAIQAAVQVAPTDLTVLITGESGSGKESFSKIIHQLSRRKHGQFIAINCGAIPEGTINSELFGHEKGAFTGASDSRKGYFEVTDGGTIFLDEIAELPLETQARLLRILENREFIKVGSSKVQKTDVRVVAATNVDLLDKVHKGKFREDLFYRISTVPIYVPPLRERGSDIYLLFRKFATDFAEKYRVKPIQLDTEAQAILLKYRFPGNIRQLKNLVEQISALEMERNLSSEKLIKYLPNEPRSNYPALVPSEKENDFSERDLLYKVLFDMRKDMTELKKLVLSMLQGNTSGKQIFQKHKDLFDNVIEEDNFEPSETNFSPLMIQHPEEETKSSIKSNTLELDRIEDITPELEEDSLSLQKQEKEMIIKALRKNNNKRKYAAQDLGISERTLYRKIKQYEIEN